MIAFRGSVFSPTYYRARQSRIDHHPDEFCGINVVLYGPGCERWVFTEPSIRDVATSSSELSVAGSRLWWDGDALVVDIDESTAVAGSRVRGRVRVEPELAGDPLALDPEARHLWVPVAPRARVQVQMQSPDVAFFGAGYHDSNWGRQPLEACFDSWSWSRAETPGGAAIVYDVDLPDGTIRHAVRFDRDGAHDDWTPQHVSALPRTRWALSRENRADGPTTLVRTLEDTPFYSRSIVRTHIDGREAVAVHEGLSLTRFTNPVVQLMLPFRLRRGWRA